MTGIPPFTGQTVNDIFKNIIRGEILWPDVPEEMSEEAQDLISQLLNPDPAKRLGANGAKQIKKHPFFASIDWDSILTQSKPPFVPMAAEPGDTSYFEGEFNETPTLVS